MHTLQVKQSNICGINFAQAVIANKPDIARLHEKEAVKLAHISYGKQRQEIIDAFYNGLNNIRMI